MKIDQYLTINLLKCPITDTLAGLYITRYPQWKYLLMISISLCKVGVKAILIFNKLSILLLVSTLHNDING